jgi:hypothetical protein
MRPGIHIDHQILDLSKIIAGGVLDLKAAQREFGYLEKYLSDMLRRNLLRNTTEFRHRLWVWCATC